MTFDLQKITLISNVSIYFLIAARALHNLLEWKYEQVPWPSMTAPITELINVIFKRLNEASGTYQMFAVLGDVIILKK